MKKSYIELGVKRVVSNDGEEKNKEEPEGVEKLQANNGVSKKDT